MDKLRHLVASNTDLILRSAKYVAGVASTAFPPSSAILTALTFVVTASQDVSKDYDKIAAFFEELHAFLERVSMLEQRLPQLAGYQHHLMQVFSAILKVCGLVTKATKEGRLKRFGKTILRGGEDSELADASGALDTAMKRLESATGFATLVGVQEANEGTRRLEEKSDQASRMLYDLNANVQSSHSDTIEMYQVMSAKLDHMSLTRSCYEITKLGLCLGKAPQIEPGAFKGREDELQQLRNALLPTEHPTHQCIVSIVGMGGMGKTQLSLAHVRDCGGEYASVFWVNAKDETSLRQDLAALSTIVHPEMARQTIQTVEDEKLAVERVRRWLSGSGNDQWLLIFDNYDDPQLSGIRSPTGYDIRSFFPMRSQGSILITTRSTKLAFSTKQLHLKKLEDVSTSVAILSQRSGCDLSGGKFAEWLL